MSELTDFSVKEMNSQIDQLNLDIEGMCRIMAGQALHKHTHLTIFYKVFTWSSL